MPDAAAVDAGQDSVAPFAALLLFTVLLFLAPQAFLPGLGRVRIALLVGAAAIVMHVWTRFAAGRPITVRAREMWLVAALLGWMVFTLPFSHWPSTSARILLGDYLKTVGVFWLLSNVVSNPRRLRIVAWTLTFTAVPLAATGLVNFVTGNLMPGGMAGGGRIAGFDAPLASDANTLAMVLNLILPLSVALMLTSRRPLVQGLLAAIIALAVSAVIVTFSRGGFLTLVIIFMLYLRVLLRGGRRRWAVAALVLVIAAVPALPLGYVDRLATIRNIGDDETGSAQSRWELTRQGLRYALHDPLGAGLGMSIIADCNSRGIPAASCARVCAQIPCLLVHNVYLQYAMDLGWIGLVLFMLLLASCVATAARIRRRCADQPGRRDLATWAEAIRIAIVGFAVNALFFPWGYFIYFYFVAGLAVALGAIYAAEVAAPRPAGRRDARWWSPIPA